MTAPASSARRDEESLDHPFGGMRTGPPKLPTPGHAGAPLPQDFDRQGVGGRLLAVFDRSSRERGGELLLMTAESYEGHPFLRLQRWWRGRERWCFDRDKQVTIRERDVGPLVAALELFQRGSAR